MGEVRDALLGMARGKAPGSDGLPAEFYQKCWNILGGDLVDVLNFGFREGTLSLSQRTGQIALLFKKGDRLDRKNWRPVTLLNADYKLCARALAGHLRKVIHHVVHPDQTCGVPGRFIGENVALLRDVVQFADDVGCPAAILYVASLVRMPIWATRELNKSVFSFFWQGKPNLVKRAVVCQPPERGAFGVASVAMKVQALLAQWVRHYDASPNSWVSLLTYWCFDRFGVGPTAVFAAPRTFSPAVLPPFYGALLRAWRAVGGSGARPLGLAVPRPASGPCCVADITCRSCYSLLLDRGVAVPHCVTKFACAFGDLGYDMEVLVLHAIGQKSRGPFMENCARVGLHGLPFAHFRLRLRRGVLLRVAVGNGRAFVLFFPVSAERDCVGSVGAVAFLPACALHYPRSHVFRLFSRRVARRSARFLLHVKRM